MIIKRVKIVYKTCTSSITRDTFKRTSYCLFGIIPLYIKMEFVCKGRL